MKTVEILDCTLRDASYPIAYQFTAEDTAVISAGLEAAGFTRIEVGHGVGLGASGVKYGSAAATDEEYLRAAASALTTAKFGAFAIPGIATLDHVRLAAKTGAGFIRIGTDVTATAEAESFIKLAKDLGLEVSANFMKTYAVPVAEVIRRAQQIEGWGADIVCVVDSAGGMLPADVRQYVEGLRAQLNAKVGFHGHNNMQLAVANTLAAVEAGAHIVDTTLRGLGRSSGNAQTEVLVMILQRLGIECGIDAYRAMDLGDKLIAPLAQGRGIDSLELASGYAQFHSSFLGMVERVAHELQVDPRELIIRVSSVNKITLTESLVRKSAGECQRPSQDPGTSATTRSFDFDVNEIAQGADLESAARRVADEMRTVAKKTGRRTVFTVAISPSGEDSAPVFPFIRLSAGYVIGNVEVPTGAHAEVVAGAIDGIVDFVLVDAEVSDRGDLPRSVAAILKKSRLLTYRDADAQIDATEAIVGQLFGGVPSLSVGLCGLSPFAMRLGVRLLERGARLFVWDENKELAKRSCELLKRWCESQGWAASGRVDFLDPGSAAVDLLIGARARNSVVTESLIECVREGGAALDAGIGTLSAGAVDRARERGLRLYRLDMRAGLTGQVAIAIETSELLSNVIGESRVAGIDVVAGGVVGRAGTVVLDAIRYPTRVVGVANGLGQLMSAGEAFEFKDSVALVRKELVRNRLPWSISASTP